MFGRMFSIFNPGSGRGVTIAPQPIILATAGVRFGSITFNGTEINAGAQKIIAPAVPGFILYPIAWCSVKNIVVIHNPLNTTFNLRYNTIATNLGTGLTPQVLSLGIRTDANNNIGTTIDPGTNVPGKALVVVPSGVNNLGSVNNKIRFTVAYQLVPTAGVI